jgi:outer membrane lipoprotein-sorting protein
MKRLAVFLFLILFSVSNADVMKELKNKMRTIGTIKADFVQVVNYDGFDEADTYGGNLVLNKKGQILVKYKKNYKMIVYVNKDRVKYYDPEEKQVYTRKIRNEFFLELFQTFMKNGDIDKFFTKVSERKLKNKDVQLVLTPKPKYKKQGLTKVIFTFDKNLKIKRVQLFTDDNKMDYRFKNVRYYRDIKSLRFTTKL